MYYFTFGSDGQLFKGGWVRIKADTLAEAQKKFIDRYGYKAWKSKNCLSCAFFYTEDEFIDTEMYLTGDNLGAGEHEYID